MDFFHPLELQYLQLRIETLLTKAGVAEDVATARLQEFDSKIAAARKVRIR